MSLSGKQALLLWCQRSTAEYQNVSVTNFTTSWSDGLAFCAIIHKYRPNALNYHTLTADNAAHNHGLAFCIAESMGIPALLDVEDMLIAKPEPHSVMTYLSQYYHFFQTGSTRPGGIAQVQQATPAGRGPSGSQNQPQQAQQQVAPAPAGRGSGIKPRQAVARTDSIKSMAAVEKCAKCDKPLSGSTAKNNGKQYHASCFTCFTCATPLRGRCMNIDNQAYCEKCGKTAFLKSATARGEDPAVAAAQLAAASGGPAAGKGVRQTLLAERQQHEQELEQLQQRLAREEAETKRAEMLARMEAERVRVEEERRRAEETKRVEAEQRAKRDAQMRQAREEEARREQEAAERATRERLAQVQRERVELERADREREAERKREMERALEETRQRKEAAEREKRERDEAARREREKRAQEEEELRKAAAARLLSTTTNAGSLSRNSGATAAKKSAAHNAAPASDGVPEWQRLAQEKAKKRALTMDAGAASPAAAHAAAHADTSSHAHQPEWQRRAAEVHSKHDPKAPRPADDAAPPVAAVHVSPPQKPQPDLPAEAPRSPRGPRGPVPKPPVATAAPSEPDRPARPPPVRVDEAPKTDTAPKSPKSPKGSSRLPPQPPVPQRTSTAAGGDEPKSPKSPHRGAVPLAPLAGVSDRSSAAAPDSASSPKSPRSPRGGRAAPPPPQTAPFVKTPTAADDEAAIAAHQRQARKFASFGVTLEEIMTAQRTLYPNEELPKVWTTMVRLIHENGGLDAEGIFRMSGASFEIDRLKETLNKGAFDVQFSGDVHTVSCALKQWITELAEPILPYAIQDALLHVLGEGASPVDMAAQLTNELKAMPLINKRVFVAWLELMRQVLARTDANRMVPANLAIVFSPGLFKSNVEDAMEFMQRTQLETRFVELMLRNPPSTEEVMRSDYRASAVRPKRTLASQPAGAGSSATQMQTPLAMVEGGAAAAAAAAGANDAAGQIATYVVRGDLLQGYLLKENPNGIARLWKRRWFVQHQKKLLYYADVKPGAERGDGLKGFVPLQRASVSALPGYARREFAFAIITPERTFHFQAADAADLHYWISSLHDVLGSPAMQAPESEYTTGADAASLLPARDASFARDAFAGELECKVGPLQIWKKRYIVLSDGILYAFKDLGHRKPERKVFLYGSHLEEFEPTAQECVAFRVRAATGSDIILRATSQEVMSAWSNAVLRHRLSVEDQIDSIAL